MNITAFANLSFFDLPIEKAEHFPSNIGVIFSNYLEKLRLIDDEYKSLIDKHYNRIHLTCDQIQKIINSVFEGKMVEAYQTLSSFISHFEVYLSAEKNSIIHYENTDCFFYRARMNINQERYDIKEMFHVPFEKRYNIKTQRFSISGLPCLYLADSIYTCWEELNRPDLEQVEFSMFTIVNKSVRFLDVSNHIDDVRDLLRYNLPPESKLRFQEALSKELERFIHLFPLYVACYAKVYDPDAVFKPEYILPQLIMQYVASTKYFNGVKYQSTKAQTVNADYPYSPVNYAIPVQSSPETGFCALIASKFKITRPVRFITVRGIKTKDLIGEVNRINVGLLKGTLQRLNSPNNNYVTPVKKILTACMSWSDYSETDFGKLEHYLYLQEQNHLGK